MGNSIQYLTRTRITAFIFAVVLTGYLASPFLRYADASPPPLPAITSSEDVKIIASDGSANDQFGYSVAVSGDTAVIGALNEDEGGPVSGSVYIYERNSGGANNWGEVKKLVASDPAIADEFGYSVSVSGDTIIVGARSNDDNGSKSGSAYIFERNSGGTDNWGEVKKLTASDAAGGDLFGGAVSISGDTSLVAAIGEDDI